MAMLPQLFSLSGLAVELDLDRRTVATRLRNVRPDGALPGGSPGWRLTTALHVLKGEALATRRSNEDIIADVLESRLGDPRIVTEGDRMLVSVSEAARMLGVDCETVLVWLRTGAPYASAGNWSSGIGFVVNLSLLVDWLLPTGAHLAFMGREDLLEALRIPGSTAPTSTKFGSHHGFGRGE